MTAATASPFTPEAKRLLLECRQDPALFARKILGVAPTPQQETFLRAVAKKGAHVAVRSGHGIGKSKTLAMAALWFLMLHADAVVPCTAPTAHQLEDILWREIRLCIDGMNERWRDLFTVSGDKVTMEGSKGFIVARTARTEKPDALQGFHAKNIFFIIDEAAGVADNVFDVARGALSTPGAKVAITGNPTRLNGYFYNTFHIARDSWTCLHFSSLDSPMVGPEFAREIAREFGEDSDMYRIRVLGEFPRSGLMSVIPLEWVEAAMARTLPVHVSLAAPKILGADLALEGTDRTVVAMRQGVYAKVLKVAQGLVTSQLVTMLTSIISTEQPDVVFADKTGLGAPVVHLLNDLGYRQVIGVNFGETAGDRERFVRRREEMWWLMREWFERDDPAVEYDASLRDDLIAPDYIRDANLKIRLESKDSMQKRGLASPDYGDALALTFAMPVVPAGAGGHSYIAPGDAGWRNRLQRRN